MYRHSESLHMSAEILMLQIFLLSQLVTHDQHTFFTASVFVFGPYTMAVTSVRVGESSDPSSSKCCRLLSCIAHVPPCLDADV